MSRTGNCYDNAVAERFFWSLKYEWTNHRVYPDLESARQRVFNYIEIFYNQRRRHQTLDLISPSEFETEFHNRITKAAETTENSRTVTAV
jgi:putative transposase